jgi:hypothetical protein
MKYSSMADLGITQEFVPHSTLQLREEGDRRSWKRFYSERNEKMSIMEFDEVVKCLELADNDYFPDKGQSSSFQEISAMPCL